MAEPRMGHPCPDWPPHGYREQGAILVCVHCGAVYEGTAAYALDHYRSCVRPREAAAALKGSVP